MNHLFLSAVFAIAAGSYGVFLTFAVYPSVAGASQLRTTFDGNIRNNSLALSPDETIAVVFNSERTVPVGKEPYGAAKNWLPQLFKISFD
ncbi:hypothetical protein [Collimonas sp. OK607]|uniref:hypothetical protein n=1 Tax=Collimonas sp. OK607 TaxID=1798194 RepID=UPI000B816020|nr:hypothetical protein [Collimonas sp. OK607]